MKASEVIEQTAKQTARAVIAELKRSGLIKENRLGSFKKTERILYEYGTWSTLGGTIPRETGRFMYLVDLALNKVKNDPYFDLIRLKYFEHWTHEKIAEYFGVDVSVISKRRTKLIDQLRPIIFSDDFIRELYEL